LTQEEARDAVDRWSDNRFGFEVFTTATTTSGEVVVAAQALVGELASALGASGMTAAACDADTIPVGFETAIAEAAPRVRDACQRLEQAVAVQYQGREHTGGYGDFAQASRDLVAGDEALQRELLSDVCFRVFNNPSAFRPGR
jgi:hypothetical protein